MDYGKKSKKKKKTPSKPTRAESGGGASNTSSSGASANIFDDIDAAHDPSSRNDRDNDDGSSDMDEDGAGPAT
jgi:hypothetical protein